MDRIDVIHQVAAEFGTEIFYSREPKLRRALNTTSLTFQEMEDIVDVCMISRKYTKKILLEPDISKTRDLQKELVVKFDGKSISVLKDIHTAIYSHDDRPVSVEGNSLDDGRFSYSMVSGRKQCLNLTGLINKPSGDIVIPDTVLIDGKEHKVVSIADGCFEGNQKIISVTLPAGLETIGKNAFCNCSALIKCVLPRHLKSIGENAFAYTSVEEVEFGERLEEIGNMAFYKCRSLRKVVMTKRTSQLGVGAFSGCSSLATMDIDSKNGRYVFEEGVLYTKKKDRVVCVSSAYQGKLILPRTLVSIDQYAAEDCTGITELDLPVSLISIGACAFLNCTGIAKVKSPNTLEKIGDRSFDGCSSIASIDIPASVRSIGKSAFRNCSAIKIGEISGTVDYRGLKIFEGCTGLNRLTIRKNSEYSDSDFPKNCRIKFVHE